MPVVAVFPAIGVVAIWDWIASRADRGAPRLVAVLLILVVLLNGLTTFRDSFGTWTARREVREIYQASLTQAFRDLNHSNLEGALWISEPFPDDRHLMLASRLLYREAIDVHWFNADRALILPPIDTARRYLLADFVEPDQELSSRWMGEAVVVLEARSSSSAVPAYRVYQVRGSPWMEQELSGIISQSSASLDIEAAHPVNLPARFEGVATLLGYELADSELAPGADVHLVVYWRVHGPVFEPIASFAHLLDDQNDIVGQYDGFDVPPRYWDPEAIVAQVYRFSINQDVQPGTHWLEVGLYNSQTMERLPVVDEAGNPFGSRLVLGTVSVERHRAESIDKGYTP